MISNRKHRQEIVRVSQAYRWELEEERAKLASKLRELDDVLDRTARASHVDENHRGEKMLVIRVNEPMLGRLPENVNWVYERWARRIVEGLVGIRKDYRPDMRQVANREEAGCSASLPLARYGD